MGEDDARASKPALLELSRRNPRSNSGGGRTSEATQGRSRHRKLHGQRERLLPELPHEGVANARPDWNCFVVRGNRWQTEMVPTTHSKNMPGKVVNVEPLMDNDDRTAGFAV